MFPAIGSKITQEISFSFDLIIFSTLLRLLYCAINVSFAVPLVTPGLFGSP